MHENNLGKWHPENLDHGVRYNVHYRNGDLLEVYNGMFWGVETQGGVLIVNFRHNKEVYGIPAARIENVTKP